MNARIIQGAFWCLVLTLFSFCSKEESSPDPETETLVGTWTVSEGTLNSPSLGTLEGTTSGTITFNKNGTGQENYSYTILGVTVKEDDSFTWTSTSSKVVFDGGTSDEMVWDRIVNENDRQKGMYTIFQDNETRSITLTLTR